MARPRTVSNDEIIEAAQECIAEYGPTVSTAKIAERVSVSAQALLKRYGNKENLILAAIEASVQPEWAEDIPDDDDERSLYEQLRDVAHGASSFFHGLARGLFAAQWGTVRPCTLFDGDETPAPVHAIQTIAAWLERLFERGMIRQVDFQACALAFLGAIQVRSMLEHATGIAPTDHERGEYVDQIAAFYAELLAPN